MSVHSNGYLALGPFYICVHERLHSTPAQLKLKILSKTHPKAMCFSSGTLSATLQPPPKANHFYCLSQGEGTAQLGAGGTSTWMVDLEGCVAWNSEDEEEGVKDEEGEFLKPASTAMPSPHLPLPPCTRQLQ